jgi:hypothetical protein
MTRIALFVSVLAGCASSGDDYPVLTDQGGGETATAQLISGRVCVIVDPRDLVTCSPSGGGGLVVSAGSGVALTRGDGSFTVSSTAPLTGSLTVSGPGVVPTLLPVSAVHAAVPVLQADLFQEMLAAADLEVTPGTGSILATVTHEGQPVSGVTVTTAPIGAGGPFFDGATATGFTLDGTGARGIVWAPGIVAGPTSLTFTDIAHATETTVGGVQVVDGGLTLTDAVLE